MWAHFETRKSIGDDNPLTLFPRISFRCIQPECHLSEIATTGDRGGFFRSHVMKKKTERVIDILKNVGLVMPWSRLGRYTILNIFTDLCKEPYASEIINGVYSND
ncbi:MAG: hypothetical protein IIC67_03185 [Thaumarchaeota archaeon]|nr:hypothetical protein [Nitrososphaerota archaeon]